MYLAIDISCNVINLNLRLLIYRYSKNSIPSIMINMFYLFY